MKKIRSGLAFILIMFCAAVLSAAEVKVEKKYGKSFRGSLGDVPVLVLCGSDGERGEAHGYLCAKEIVRVLNDYCAVGVMLGGLTAYEMKIRKYVPEFKWEDRYMDELEGMMRGIRKALPEKKDRMMTIAMREVDVLDLMAANSLADWVGWGWGCSSFSVWGEATPDGQVVTGRNLDYKACQSMLDSQCIMASVPSSDRRRATIGISYFGVVGVLTALNEDGVFLAIHDSKSLGNNGRRYGFTPRALALRDALERASGNNAVADVRRVLRNNAVAVGNNIHVSSSGKSADASPVAAVLEWDAADKDSGVTVREGENKDGAWGLVCTNHYRSRRSDAGRMKCGRYHRLLEAIVKKTEGGGKVATFEGAKNILQTAMGGATLHSVIVWPSKRKMVVARSRQVGVSAGKFPWTEFTWEDILPGSPGGHFRQGVGGR